VFHYPGARKKKSLTDPVDIIPFPNQNLRDLTKKTLVKPVVKKEAKKVFMQKEAPRVLTTPSRQVNTSAISIKKMLQKTDEVNETKGLDIDNMPKNAYTIDDLKMAWRRFAFKMKEKRKETIYNALIKREPKQISDHQYILIVDNQVQVDYIKPYLGELISYIISEVKNYLIDLKVEISQNQEPEVKFQTGKDKFTALARKNPNLHTLKNKFNLDIEY
jgi:hypothetical protein